MGEIAKRTEEEQHEIEDSVLALSEAGWTYRDVAKELGVSKNSIQTYRERALARVPIPDHEEAVRENIVQLKWVQDECRRRLADANLPNTSINVGNLLREFRMAREALNKELENYRRKDETFGGMTIFQFITHPDMREIMERNTEDWENYTETVENEDGVHVPVD